MSKGRRFEPELRERCAAPQWKQPYPLLAFCDLRHDVAPYGIEVAARSIWPAGTGRIDRSNTSVRVDRSERAANFYPHRAPGSAHLLLRYEINCDGQNQKTDRQFDHGILQRLVKRT